MGEVCRKWQHALGKIAVYPPQKFEQLFSLVFGKAGKGLGTDLVREVQNARQDRPSLVRQDEAAGTPVAGLGLPTDLEYMSFVDTGDLVVCRTGYTGEVGYELVIPWSGAGAVWDSLIAAGVQPCGLGARDT